MSPMRTRAVPVTLAELVRSRVAESLQGDAAVAVTGVQRDSRRVSHGDLFVALPGEHVDGGEFAHAAARAGACAVLTSAPIEGLALPQLLASDVRRGLALASHIVYGEPSSSLEVVGITGTNGKTTTSYLLEAILMAAGKRVGLIGTVAVRGPGYATTSGYTTPEADDLVRYLAQAVSAGASHLVMEVSSHGLELQRVLGTRFAVCGFTNLSQDHLDFHHSMSDYWEAKAALFHWPGLQTAVVNIDDPQGMALDQALAGRPELGRWSVGIDRAARLMARDLVFTDHGMRFEVVEHDAAGTPVDQGSLAVDLIGRYNVSNLLGVIGAARALGLSLADALAACRALSPVPGRMEQVALTQGQPLVLVDYAHTPDALEKALRALQPLSRQRGGAVWVLAGCGGDRDPGKRPLMASVAEREAQHVVLTSDNPRSENPAAILDQMRAGLERPEQARVEIDRASAIADTVARAAASDVVLIAGKGHEDYQEVMGVKTPFSDLAHARAALDRRLSRRAA